MGSKPSPPPQPAPAAPTPILEETTRREPVEGSARRRTATGGWAEARRGASLIESPAADDPLGTTKAPELTGAKLLQ